MDETIREQLLQYYSMTKETDAYYNLLAEKSGISSAMYWVLYAIRVYGEAYTQRDICSAWCMSKQTVNSALKKLESEGYIFLKASEKDRRSKLILLTEHGKSFCEKNIDVILKAEEEALDAMGKENRELFMKTFAQFDSLLRQRLTGLLKNTAEENV